jgi:ectoine hydroxylase-related dioxygenase (phytanoyl-CoA dioxygenase family)
MKSRIALTQAEIESQKLSDTRVQSTTELFRKHGAIWMKGVFRKSLIQELLAVYTQKYIGLSKQELRKRDASVGDQRFMITVKIKGAFNDPELYANPVLLPLLDNLLSQHCRIASFGSVVALPGADDQPIHLDHPPLFESNELCCSLPPHAITMVVPLVDVSEDVGTTAIWEGTHHSADRTEQLQSLMSSPNYESASMPLPKQGDVYMMDYRVIHGGMANRSKIARPILYIVYSRPWFKDAFNFSSQPSVQISDKQRKKVPKKLQSLFA